jgi:hypothetical protein
MCSPVKAMNMMITEEMGWDGFPIQIQMIKISQFEANKGMEEGVQVLDLGVELEGLWD